MKIVKFEKENCGPCNMVEGWLNDNNVTVEHVNPFKSEEGQTRAAKYRIGMTLPVVVLVDNEDNVIQLSRGYKPDELEEIVAKSKA